MKNLKSIGLLLALINGFQVANGPQKKIKTITIADGDKTIPISIDVTNAKTTTIIHNGKPIEIIDLEPDPWVITTYEIKKDILYIKKRPNLKYWSMIGRCIGNLTNGLYNLCKLIRL